MAEKLTFNQKIRREVNKVKDARASRGDAEKAMASLDLTSLSGNETDEDIQSLCDKAIAGNVAAVCVYPQFVKKAAQALAGTNIQVATVVNFPFGNENNAGEPATTDDTDHVVRNAIKDGATEIDIVMDYQGYHAMEENLGRDLLYACRDACGDDAKMKVILETSAFRFEDEVFDMAKMAMDCGADMIKTSTGKHENGGATLEMVASMAFAIKDFFIGRPIGLKVSGGVKGDNYVSYLAIVQNIMGEKFVDQGLFRFGASGLYNDLQATLTGSPRNTAKKQSLAAEY